MPSIRTFIAVPLNEGMTAALAGIQEELRVLDRHNAARWTRPESAHLTLKFLGDVNMNRVPAIGQALEDVARRHPQFGIQAHGVGCFPDCRRSRVIWVGLVESSGALQDLQADLEQRLEQLGFPREQRPFSPHLTLARIRKEASRGSVEALGQALEGLSRGEIAQMHVDHVALIKSDLRPQGPIYTELCVADLSAG